MFFLGLNEIFELEKKKKIMYEGEKIIVKVEKISRSSKESFVYFKYLNKLYDIRVRNRIISNDSIKINEELELHYNKKYPSEFIYKARLDRSVYLPSIFLIFSGLIVLVFGVIRSNIDLIK